MHSLLASPSAPCDAHRQSATVLCTWSGDQHQESSGCPSQHPACLDSCPRLAHSVTHLCHPIRPHSTYPHAFSCSTLYGPLLTGLFSWAVKGALAQPWLSRPSCSPQHFLWHFIKPQSQKLSPSSPSQHFCLKKQAAFRIGLAFPFPSSLTAILVWQVWLDHMFYHFRHKHILMCTSGLSVDTQMAATKVKGT